MRYFVFIMQEEYLPVREGYVVKQWKILGPNDYYQEGFSTLNRVGYETEQQAQDAIDGLTFYAFYFIAQSKNY